MLLSFAYQPYLAIIGDIKGSKQLDNRAGIQDHFRLILAEVNEQYSADIASDFMITLGDEFQGLLKSGAHVMDILDRIERELFPIRFRFGIGVGEITTAIHSHIPLGADGPAFYLARQQIEDLKSSEKKNKESKRNIAIGIEGNEQVSALLNTIFSLQSVIKDAWTIRQVEIINAYLQGDGTQTGAAKMLKINQSNVQKALAASNFYTYRNALESVSALLSEIGGECHV